jgi:hypothetical protein
LKDWREHVIYAVSERHAPDGDAGSVTPALPLLSVTLADGSIANDIPAVVMLGGKALGSQVRTSNIAKNSLGNYADGVNASGSNSFDARITATQNDQVWPVKLP